MKRGSTTALLIGMLLSISACDSNSTEDGTTPVLFSVRLASDSSNLSKSALAENLQFTSGTIIIREIVFDGENQTTGESVSLTHEQIVEINLMTGISSPPIESLLIPSGTYTSANLGVEIQDVNSEPTIVIEGTYTRSDASIVPIRFEFNSGEVFEAESDQVTLTENRSAVAEITFDPLVWFEVISAQQLDDADMIDGVIVIKEGFNDSLFDAVADRLDMSTQAQFK